jgi:hypothetical protein
MDDEQTASTASTADNRQQDAIAAMREILTPLLKQANQAARPRGRPPGRELVPSHLSRKGKRGPKNTAAIAANAITHGLTSREVVIPGLEDPGEFAAFRQRLIDDRAPVGAVEEAICERIAELMWRLRRIAPYEAQLVTIARDMVAADYQKLHSWTYGRDTLPEEFLLAENAAAEEAADAIGRSGEPHTVVSEAAGHEFAAVLVDEDEDLADEPLPGFEEGIRSIPEDEWSIGVMSAAIRNMAGYLEKDVTDFALLLHERLRARIENRAQDIEKFLLQKDVMSRERQMPPPQQLLNLSKYEAHLGRQLAQSLTQLESLQARRNGRPIPTQVVHFSTGG